MVPGLAYLHREIQLDVIGVNAHNLPSYYTSETTKIMGISPVHLRYLSGKGEVEGKKLGHDWVVLSLDYKRRRKPKTSRKEGGGNEKS